MIRLKAGFECGFDLSDHGPQLANFPVGQVADVLAVAPNTDHTLAQSVMVAVHHHAPEAAGIDYFSFPWLAQCAVYC